MKSVRRELEGEVFGGIQVKKPHILLVDDEENFRFSAGVALRSAGYAVTEAADGSQALSLLVDVQRCKNDPPDLLLTDIRMPRMSGVELIEGLRGHGITVPILILSGFADRQVIENLRAMGYPDFLEKPFEPEDLVIRIEEILGRSGEAVG